MVKPSFAMARLRDSGGRGANASFEKEHEFVEAYTATQFDGECSGGTP